MTISARGVQALTCLSQPALKRCLAPSGTAGEIGSLPFDTSVANQARMHDYVPGGKDNYAVDREAAEAWLAILHVIPDSDDPHAIVARLMDAVPAGSYLAVSHVASEFLDQEAQDKTRDLAGRMIQQQPNYRSREQVARFFDGTDLVAPGLVRVDEWRPDPGTRQAGKSSWWGGVGRKR